MTRTAYASGAAYELGENSAPAAELDELAEHGHLLDPAAGFRTYHYSDADVTELMAVAASKTLAVAGLAPAEVDAVVLATDSLPRGRAAQRDVADLLARLGLGRAAGFTVGLMDCATALVAVSVAASLVRDGSCAHVLVLCGDLADMAAPGSRVVAGGAAVASDGAASVLVSATVPGRPVLAAARHAAPELARSDAPPSVGLGGRVHAHHELMARLRAGYPHRPAELAAVFPSNFARNVIGLYLADVGFRTEQVYLANVGRTGHCLGSDPLINLADGGADAAGPCLLLGSGVSHLAAVLLGEAS